MQSPCLSLSGRAVTVLAENKALKGKIPDRKAVACFFCLGFFIFLPGTGFTYCYKPIISRT